MLQSVLQTRILIIKPMRCTNFSNLFLEQNSTCFEQFLCPSSGVYALYVQQQVYVIQVMLIACQQAVSITCASTLNTRICGRVVLGYVVRVLLFSRHLQFHECFISMYLSSYQRTQYHGDIISSNYKNKRNPTREALKTIARKCEICQFGGVRVIPDSYPHRIKSTKCRRNTDVSPDDGSIVARNMQRLINIRRMNCAPSWSYLQNIKFSSVLFDFTLISLTL